MLSINFLWYQLLFSYLYELCGYIESPFSPGWQVASFHDWKIYSWWSDYDIQCYYFSHALVMRLLSIVVNFCMGKWVLSIKKKFGCSEVVKLGKLQGTFDSLTTCNHNMPSCKHYMSVFTCNVSHDSFFNLYALIFGSITMLLTFFLPAASIAERLA